MKAVEKTNPVIKERLSLDNSKTKIDNISIFEYMVFDEFKNEETEETSEDSKKD